MSQQIICQECEFANPPGSKFCNNCGARLPLGTHIICANCGNANPIDRIFCDQCGTRLIPEEPKPDEKPKDEASPASGKAAFSLPARKPGETGDLDPRNVPDWLKTGKHSEEEDEEDDQQELPRIEEITRKKHTDDLPEWLVDEADSDPIIRAPTIISTEFYKDLLDRAEVDLPQPDELFPEGDVELPDWLRDDGPKTGPQSPPAAKLAKSPGSPKSEKGLTDWLSEPPETPQTPLPPRRKEPDTGQSLTSWLSDPSEEPKDERPLAEQTDTDSLTDWLSDDSDEPVDEPPGDIQESLTNWLSDFSDEVEVTADETRPAAEKPDMDGLTDWLTPGAEEPVVEAASDIHQSLTGWLEDLPDEDQTEAEEPDAEKPESHRLTEWLSTNADIQQPVAEADSDIHISLTDWLGDFPDEDDGGEALPVVEEADSGGLTAWLTGEEEDGEPTSEAEDWDISDRLTSWLKAKDAGTTAVPTPDTPDDDTDETQAYWFLQEDELPEEESTTSEPSSPSESRFDEAARLAAWFESKPEAKPTKEHFEWLEEPEPPVAAPIKQKMPSDMDWLDETEEDLANIFQSQPGIEEDLPDWLAGVAAAAQPRIPADDEDDSHDLDDIFSAERKAAATEIDFLRETGSLRLDDDATDPSSEAEDEDTSSAAISPDELDWLAALATMGDDIPSFLDEVEEAAAEPEPFADEPVGKKAPTAPGQAAAWADHDESEEWSSPKTFKTPEEASEALPAWISQLDATRDLPDDEDELIPSDELPDWVANLRPSQGIGDSVLPGALMPENLAGVPEELVGADLPNWLQDFPRDAQELPPITMPADTQLSDIPDWLQAGLALDDADADILADSSGGTLELTPVSDEWTAILNDLPPAVPLEEMLSKAEIPDWVMALKPAELTGEAPKAQPAGPEETFGPLSGLRGVVTIEPVIALPRVAGPLKQFLVSPEQQQQVALLRQLSQNGQSTDTAVTTKISRDISGWLRPLFALVLIIAVVLGLRGETPVEIPGEVPVALSGVQFAVNRATSHNVLVAFEYTPAMAGELTPAAETLLAHLQQNESPTLTISQYTTGATLAEQIGGRSVTHLGYLPGGAIGLRWLGECLNENANCDRLFGRPLTADEQRQLQNVALIIVLTSDRQSLVNWIEQVGASDDRPMVAGVTQALAPIAAPYFETQQLEGVLNGVPGTAVYEQTYFTGNPHTQSLFSAQVTAQMLLIVVLLLGALIYIISGMIERRRT